MIVNTALPLPVRRRSDKGLIGALILFGCITVLAIGSLGQNMGLVTLTACTFALGSLLLWRPGETPILLVVFLFQWLQGSIDVFRSSVMNVPVESLFNFDGSFAQAIVLTHLSLAVMAIGMRIAIGTRRPETSQNMLNTLNKYSATHWFRLYAIFWVVGALATIGQRLVPGLSQVFLGVIDLRWAFYFLLATAFFAKPKASGMWFFVAFGFELINGLGGFFSDFKTVFIVTFLGIVAAGIRITPKWMMLATAISAGAIYMGVLWTAIKPEYRSYVSGGQATQTVNVGLTEQFGKLVELSQNVDQSAYSQASEQFAERLGYVKFFGATLDYVPSEVSHEDGALTIDAVTRPFMPRMFFPNKSIIDDSVRTARYTGLEISGRERGTSISLGWVSELYVDFGQYFMLIAALGLGLFYGGVQRFLTSWPASSPALGMACSSAILMGAILLESSITKVMGGLIASLIATVLIIKYVVPVVAPELVRKR